jgi:hypothetical protein
VVPSLIGNSKKNKSEINIVLAEVTEPVLYLWSFESGTIRRPQAKGGRKKPLFIPNHKKAFFLTSGAGRRSGDLKRTPTPRGEDEERGRNEGGGAEQPKEKR